MGLPVHYQELEMTYANTIGRGVQVLAVTSSDSREGVSTLAEALALRSEAGGKKTLLVDLNMYHPSVDKRFVVLSKSDANLSNSDKLSVMNAEGTNICIVTAPTADSNQLRLRERDVLKMNIDSWRKAYDSIIIDTSPLNAINRSNIPAETVCSLSDGGILVVLAGKTTEISVQGAYTRLANAGARLLGTVINDRFNPSLSSELVRETYRLEKHLPGLMAKVRGMIRCSKFLNPVN